MNSLIVHLLAFAAAVVGLHASALAQSNEPVPRAVTVARTTEIPACTLFVDAASRANRGTPSEPFRTMADAVRAAPVGAVICVAEGTYREELSPGEKPLVLAGGFQRGKAFKVRDSAAYPTKAVGNGRGSFLRIGDPGPKGDSRTAVDGFDISGYSQAIVRDFYEPQRFDITNNHIHDNRCVAETLAGAGFSLTNVSGRIQGNVIRNNACGRGGAGFVNDGTKSGDVVIEGNLIEGNAGTEPDASHGGGLYLFATRLRITANTFVANRVTRWGGGLFVGADTNGGHQTTATLNWNVYRNNRAGISGGGFFCDDGARCISYHEIYDGNCGGNILLDSGYDGSGPTTARFEHLTNINARSPDCSAPGYGVVINKGNNAPGERYSFINALFWGNARSGDIAALCDSHCDLLRVEIAYAMVQTAHQATNGTRVRFGDGIMASADPLFADVRAGDYHLRSALGRWTPAGRIKDAATSPAVGAGTPLEAGAMRGRRIELGTYGNSAEAATMQ